MENTQISTTSPFQETFIGMSTGCTFGRVSNGSLITDLSAMELTSARTRKAVAAKGHVALIAYVPGLPAWSPPI